jgi:type III restriction enzyme
MSVPAPTELINSDLVAAVANRLDLRAPNKEALETIVYRLGEHYDVDHLTSQFEAIADVATGVGKTYVIAAAIEYFATLGTRNFAVIAPGRTIVRKTQDQFSEGTVKSLLHWMEVEPLVVTSENFDTPAIATALDDDGVVKLFVFTVQSLIRPTTKSGRKTHIFQEGLGKAFYDHLQGLTDLVVFADEHHCYESPQFSRAIRDLSPYALIGLTATPKHKDDPRIIYRYPLAAAIGDKLVKSPVIVGRQDDRSDPETKLLDGAALLQIKQEVLDAYTAVNGLEHMNAVALVVCKSIEDAKQVSEIVSSDIFYSGRYRDAVLTVHSEATNDEREAMLEALDNVESPSSPVRIIVSVGMLKEGWDVRNVYVIISLRSSVSEILTEQTLGRGLRLPFGKYTEIELLDTLEVVAHERYSELLKKSGAINEKFIDLRTHIEMRKNQFGQDVPVIVTGLIELPVEEASSGDETEAAVAGGVTLATFEGRSGDGAAQQKKTAVVLDADPDLPTLLVPRVKIREAKAIFSFAEITFNSYSNPFKEFGERLAQDPTDALRRTRLGAHVKTGEDGLRYTVIETTTLTDKIHSPGKKLSLEAARNELVERIRNAQVVPSRRGQRKQLQPIIDTFMDGLTTRARGKADEILSAYLDRAAYRMIELITIEQRKVTAKPQIERVTDVAVFAPVRQGRPETSRDLTGAFKKGVGYRGWKRSMYAQVWFDSRPERDVANVLDNAEDEIDFWSRLNRGDLEIAWENGNYNPDFIAVEKDDVHWVVEVKADNEMTSEQVQAKRLAAQQWANHVSADPKLNGMTWRYLLVRQTDVEASKGNWQALKGFGAV